MEIPSKPPYFTSFHPHTALGPSSQVLLTPSTSIYILGSAVNFQNKQQIKHKTCGDFRLKIKLIY